MGKVFHTDRLKKEVKETTMTTPQKQQQRAASARAHPHMRRAVRGFYNAPADPPSGARVHKSPEVVMQKKRKWEEVAPVEAEMAMEEAAAAATPVRTLHVRAAKQPRSEMPDSTRFRREAGLAAHIQPAAAALAAAAHLGAQQFFSMDVWQLTLVSVVLVAATYSLRFFFSYDGQFLKRKARDPTLLRTLDAVHELTEEERDKIVRDLILTRDEHFISTRILQDVLSRSRAPVRACAIWPVVRTWNAKLKRLLPWTPLRGCDGVICNLRKKLAYVLALLNIRDGDKVELRISGDGRNSNRRNFLLITFTVLRAGLEYRASDCHTIALARGKESRVHARLLMRELNEVVAELRAVPFAFTAKTGEERHVTLVPVFASDMKFLLIVLGLVSASGAYCCAFCLCDDGRRAQLAVDWSQHVRAMPDLRAGFCLNPEHKTCLAKKRGGARCPDHGVQDSPLLASLPLDSVVLDVLHTHLRITGTLLDYLLAYVERFDVERDLIDAAAAVGVTFHPTDALDKRGCSRWTPLDGHALAQLLYGLDLRRVFLVGDRAKNVDVTAWHDQYCDVFEEIWLLWRECHEFLMWDPKVGVHAPKVVRSVAQFENHVALMLLDIIGMWGPTAITPYMHVIYAHVPDQIRRYGSIARFSCSAQELLNARQGSRLFSNVRPADSCQETIEAEHRILYSRYEAIMPERREYATRKLEHNGESGGASAVPAPKVCREFVEPPKRQTRTLRRRLAFDESASVIPLRVPLDYKDTEPREKERLRRAEAARMCTLDSSFNEYYATVMTALSSVASAPSATPAALLGSPPSLTLTRRLPK